MTNFTIMKKKQEQWIDLVMMGKKFVFNETNYIQLVVDEGDLDRQRIVLSHFRIALRQVNKKITKVLNCNDGTLDVSTDITIDELKIANKWYNDWVSDTMEYEVYCESDSESESESESEEENDPSV